MLPSDCWDIAVCSAFRTLTQMEQICSPSWYLSLHSVFSPDVCQSYESDHCSSMFFFPLDQISRPLLTCISTIPLKLQHLKSSECCCTPPCSPSVSYSHPLTWISITQSHGTEMLSQHAPLVAVPLHIDAASPHPPPSLLSGISVVLSQVTKSHCLLS